MPYLSENIILSVELEKILLYCIYLIPYKLKKTKTNLLRLTHYL